MEAIFRFTRRGSSRTISCASRNRYTNPNSNRYTNGDQYRYLDGDTHRYGDGNPGQPRPGQRWDRERPGEGRLDPDPHGDT